MTLSQLPLLTTLRSLAQGQTARFHIPGHQQGQGSPDALVDLIGRSALRADLPELPELDNLFAPQGVIQEAQTFAAETFGADRTWFLVNGSTSGILGAILATCGPGDKLILPRTVHKSAISGLILSGAIPIFVEPDYDPDQDLVYTVAPETIAQALARHPDTKAVLIVNPTYQGIGGDVATIAQIVHDHGIPLLVDEAHGAHFAFHPEFPPSALRAGADLCVQSTHKVLAALTQASMLHLQGDRISPQRIHAALQLVQSSSPSYLLLASLEVACYQMATQGQERMAQTLELANTARARLGQIPGIALLSPPAGPRPGFATLDPTRLTVLTQGLGITGFELDEQLRSLGVVAELPMLNHLTFIVSLGNREEDIDRLVAGVEAISRQRSVGSAQSLVAKHLGARVGEGSQQALSPREAFFAPHAVVPRADAIGQVSAELVCPYPPGIPVLMPGEVIDARSVEFLQQVLAAGGWISGCGDPSLQCLTIVRGSV